jgi:DNA-binding transcriptional regulator/RsmH inhibitor MraZ
VLYLVTRHPNTTSIDEAMLQMALRRNNANVELVSGNVTQRTNEQLVEMAENQKRRELELMQTLLKEAQPVEVDYQAEFAAREAEIEAAERSKAIIIVGDPIKHELSQPTVAETAVTPATTGTKAVAAAVKTPDQQVVLLASSKENIEMEFGIQPVDGNQKKLRRYKSQLQQAYRDLKSDHTENLTLF